VAALAIGFAAKGYASDLGLGESFQLHGFAAQAYLLTSENNFFGKSEDAGTFDFRELGLNASWRPLSRLQFSGQLLSRWAGEGDGGEPRMDYLFADYGVVSDAENLWGVRLGRSLNPLGLYNETRDVAFTRPSILLPQSIYFDRTRDLALSGDGACLYAERRTGLGEFYLDIGVGRPRADARELEVALLGRDLPGDLQGKVSYIGRLLYERDGGAIRGALSGGDISIDFDRGVGVPTAVPDSFHFRPLILSLQYNPEHWSLTGEYALRQFLTRGSSRDNPHFTGESYYVQWAVRLAHAWEFMARYDALYSDRQDRDGSQFEQETGRPGHTRFAKDFTVGLRWDVTDWAMLRAEFHNVDGTAWITMLDNDVPDLQRYWNLFALQAAFRF
jgi:hypothetical protein